MGRGGVVSAVVCPSPVFNPMGSHHLKISLNVGLVPSSNGIYSFSYICYRYKFGTSFHPGGGHPAHRRMERKLRGILGRHRSGGRPLSSVAFTKGNRPAKRPSFGKVIRSAVRLYGGCFPRTRMSMLDGTACVCGRRIERTLVLISGGVLGLSAISVSCVGGLSHPRRPGCSIGSIVGCLGVFGKRIVVRAVFLENSKLSGADRRFITP